METYKDLPDLSDYDSDDEEDFDIVEDFIADNVKFFSQTQPSIKQRLKRYGRGQKVDFWKTSWGLMHATKWSN